MFFFQRLLVGLALAVVERHAGEYLLLFVGEDVVFSFGLELLHLARGQLAVDGGVALALGGLDGHGALHGGDGVTGGHEGIALGLGLATSDGLLDGGLAATDGLLGNGLAATDRLLGDGFAATDGLLGALGGGGGLADGSGLARGNDGLARRNDGGLAN